MSEPFFLERFLWLHNAYSFEEDSEAGVSNLDMCAPPWIYQYRRILWKIGSYLTAQSSYIKNFGWTYISEANSSKMLGKRREGLYKVEMYLDTEGKENIIHF